ncbi:Maf family protein [Alteromonas sp. a30]|uniref:Maf family protein n=1 Tax=Alteromonas sp. a30 TaxID=2730917 RepID=UPI002280B48E|nr:Maf family protein [Alteromonas sp. a30]MCY7294068.1 septum formation inhibitor Maf [Alteromonas sp. a30]
MSAYNLTNLPPVILASESKYKRAVLEKLHIAFSCCAPNIDESALENESPDKLVTRLAKEKALTIAKQHPHALIIAADQVASFNSHILGKPNNEENALKQLSLFSSNRVDFINGLALYDPRTQEVYQLCETFSVQFRSLSQQELLLYIRKEKPFDCAGSFKSEGLGILLFDALIGRDPNALVGLPLIGLRELFEQAQINLLECIH